MKKLNVAQKEEFDPTMPQFLDPIKDRPEYIPYDYDVDRESMAKTVERFNRGMKMNLELEDLERDMRTHFGKGTGFKNNSITIRHNKNFLYNPMFLPFTYADGAELCELKKFEIKDFKMQFLDSLYDHHDYGELKWYLPRWSDKRLLLRILVEKRPNRTKVKIPLKVLSEWGDPYEDAEQWLAHSLIRWSCVKYRFDEWYCCKSGHEFYDTARTFWGIVEEFSIDDEFVDVKFTWDFIKSWEELYYMEYNFEMYVRQFQNPLTKRLIELITAYSFISEFDNDAQQWVEVELEKDFLMPSNGLNLFEYPKHKLDFLLNQCFVSAATRLRYEYQIERNNLVVSRIDDECTYFTDTFEKLLKSIPPAKQQQEEVFD